MRIQIENAANITSGEIASARITVLGEPIGHNPQHGESYIAFWLAARRG